MADDDGMTAFSDDARSVATEFPEIAAEWVALARADLGYDDARTEDAAATPQRCAASSAPHADDPSLLTVSTRGLASRAGGVWPAVQRRVDDGAPLRGTLELAERGL